MRITGWVAAGVAVMAMNGCTGTRSGETVEQHALRLSREAILVDAHVDLPNRLHAKMEDVSLRTPGGHFDAVRAREGGLDAIFAAVYLSVSMTPDQAWTRANADIDLVERVIAEHPAVFAAARTPADVREAARKGLIALPIGMENGSAIRTLEELDHFVRRGVRYVTLTHSDNNAISDSSFATSRKWHGLSPYGRELVAAMNRTGVMVDVSHVSDEAFDQVVKLSSAPVIATHSSCRAFVPGLERNLDDERIKALAATGGMMGINVSVGFLDAEANTVETAGWSWVQARMKERGLTWESPEAEALFAQYWREHPLPRVTVARVADHIDHVVKLVGVDHVGLGSDFDGIEHAPEGLDDVSRYPNLIAELLRRGYSEADIRKICGENLLRVWDAVQRAGTAQRRR